MLQKQKRDPMMIAWWMPFALVIGSVGLIRIRRLAMRSHRLAPLSLVWQIRIQFIAEENWCADSACVKQQLKW